MTNGDWQRSHPVHTDTIVCTEFELQKTSYIVFCPELKKKKRVSGSNKKNKHNKPVEIRTNSSKTTGESHIVADVVVYHT
jgi:hypothetical protein